MVRAKPALVILALAAVLAASDTSGGPSGGAGRPPGPAASSYFVSEAPGWTARKAYKPRPDDPVSSPTEPTLDWYPEHERFPTPGRSLAVRISGHDVPIDRLEAILTGFSCHDRRSAKVRMGICAESSWPSPASSPSIRSWRATPTAAASTPTASGP